jgi:hypothetical protein
MTELNIVSIGHNDLFGEVIAVKFHEHDSMVRMTFTDTNRNHRELSVLFTSETPRIPLVVEVTTDRYHREYKLTVIPNTLWLEEIEQGDTYSPVIYTDFKVVKCTIEYVEDFDVE